MSKIKQSKEEEFKIEKVEQALTSTELFIEKNQKNLLMGLLVIIIIVCGILGTHHFYLQPKEKNAEIALFKGEHYFAQDSFNIALNGDGEDYLGFLKVIDEYSGTASANLAYAYSGICYYKLGELETALTYLKKFNGDDLMIAPAILSTIGDCYSDMEKYDDAVSYFEKAAKADNDLISPICLKKAGLACEAMKKYDKALALYNQIKEKYPTSSEGYDADKYIERVKVLK